MLVRQPRLGYSKTFGDISRDYCKAFQMRGVREGQARDDELQEIVDKVRQ